jgi:hypothetical protein
VTITAEEWREFGYGPDYQVSSHGRVRSFKRGYPRILNPRIDKEEGYPRVAVCFPGKKAKNLRVHRLVMLAFVGEPPPNTEVCHWDGNRANGRLENLRYDTRAGNFRDAERHGTNGRGEAHPGVKLNAGIVQRIRDLHRCGIGGRKIARYLGEPYHRIAAVLYQGTWAWLPA